MQISNLSEILSMWCRLQAAEHFAQASILDTRSPLVKIACFRRHAAWLRHYLSEWGRVVNWTLTEKLPWIFPQNTTILSKDIAFPTILFFLSLDVLTETKRCGLLLGSLDLLGHLPGLKRYPRMHRSSHLTTFAVTSDIGKKERTLSFWVPLALNWTDEAMRGKRKF